MDARQRRDLDNYITGHWGEDQHGDDGETELLDSEIAQEAQDSAEELGYGDEMTADEVDE